MNLLRKWTLKSSGKSMSSASTPSLALSGKTHFGVFHGIYISRCEAALAAYENEGELPPG